MDQNVQISINARRDAFKTSNPNAGEKTLAKLDALFVQIEALGETCKDVPEFEEKYDKSDLNKQYMDLLKSTAIANAAKPKIDEIAKNRIEGKIKSEARYATNKALNEVTSRSPILSAIDSIWNNIKFFFRR